MSSLQLPLYKDNFKQAIGYSVAAHILVFLAFTVRAVFFPGEPLAYERAVRVDLVALPDKMRPDEVVVETKPEPKATPVPANPVKPVIKNDAINLEKTRSKEQEALKKIKAMNALEEIEKQVELENKKKAAARILKGNQLSSGTELSGLTKIEHDNYVANVERHIRQNWSLPEWLAQKKLKAQVRVRFDENGNIIDKAIYRSSGNPSFDEIALNTVQKSSPVPAPPTKFVKILSHEGILFGFPE